MRKTGSDYRGKVKSNYTPRVKYQNNYGNGNTSLMDRYKKQVYRPYPYLQNSISPDKKIIQVENCCNKLAFCLNEDQLVNKTTHKIKWNKDNLFKLDNREECITINNNLLEHNVLKSGTYSIIMNLDLYAEPECNDVSSMGIFNEEGVPIMNLTDHEFQLEIWSYYDNNANRSKLFSQKIYLNSSESSVSLAVNIIRKLSFCEKLYFLVTKNDSDSLMVKSSGTKLEYVLINEDTLVKNQNLNLIQRLYNSNNEQLESLDLGVVAATEYLMKWNFEGNMSYQTNILVEPLVGANSNTEIVFKNYGGYLLILMLDLELDNECENLLFTSIDTTTDFYNKHSVNVIVKCESKNDQDPKIIHTELVSLGGVIKRKLFKIPFHYRFSPQDRVTILLENVNGIDEEGNDVSSLHNIRIKNDSRFEIVCLN